MARTLGVGISAGALVAFGALAACSAITSFNGLEGTPAGDAGATDAIAKDAALGKDAGASGDAAPNSDADAASSMDASIDADAALQGVVVYSEDFESSGCDNSYGVYQGTLMTSIEAHSGGKACLVCFTNGSGFYTIDHELPGSAPAPGSVFRAQAWVKQMTGGSPNAQQFSIFLRVHDNSPFNEIEAAMSTSAPVTSTFTQSTVDYTVTKSAASWDVFIGAAEANGGAQIGDCFVIDDIVVTRFQ